MKRAAAGSAHAADETTATAATVTGYVSRVNPDGSVVFDSTAPT
jgi:hypothetical protein